MKTEAAVKAGAKTVEVLRMRSLAQPALFINIEGSWQISKPFYIGVLLQITHGSQKCQSLPAMFIYGTKPHVLA